MKGQHYKDCCGFCRTCLRGCMGRGPENKSFLPLGMHCLLPPLGRTASENTDYKSLAKDRIWAAGLFPFCLSAFPTLWLSVAQDTIKQTSHEASLVDIFSGGVLPCHGKLLWKQCWTGWLPCTSITSYSWLSCSLMVSALLPITRSANGKLPKCLSRFLTWKWGTPENATRRSCSSAAML